jgi:hypothetical protein
VGLIDTAPAVERILTEGYRRWPVHRRVAEGLAMTRTAGAVSFANFRGTRPDLSDRAAALLWCRALYGADLAQRVAAYLETHPPPMTDPEAALAPVLGVLTRLGIPYQRGGSLAAMAWSRPRTTRGDRQRSGLRLRPLPHRIPL